MLCELYQILNKKKYYYICYLQRLIKKSDNLFFHKIFTKLIINISKRLLKKVNF
jgi:hypothetical protein